MKSTFLHTFGMLIIQIQIAVSLREQLRTGDGLSTAVGESILGGIASIGQTTTTEVAAEATDPCSFGRRLGRLGFTGILWHQGQVRGYETGVFDLGFGSSCAAVLGRRSY